jgi:hypothetical protein
MLGFGFKTFCPFLKGFRQKFELPEGLGVVEELVLYKTE